MAIETVKVDIMPPSSYAAIVARYGGLDNRRSVIVLTDNAMLETARLIQKGSAGLVNGIEVINIDGTDDYSAIYTLSPEDLLIIHIGIESWTSKHRNFAYAFDKPKGIAAKYICIRPTITAQALFEGLNAPYRAIESIVRKYGNLPDDKPLRVTAKSGTNISLVPYGPFAVPYVTHKPCANAYLPPAEISYCVRPGSARGVIVVDVTVGELRVHADLIDTFGLVDEPVTLRVENGELLMLQAGIWLKG